MVMAITHEKMQVCGPVEFSHILNLSFCMRANQHGVMHLQGYIVADSVSADCLQDFEGQDFCLFTLHEPTARERKPTFRGTADKFQVIRSGEVFLAKGQIIGATAELDITLKSRSFQNVDMTYRQVVEEILRDTPNAFADFSDVADQAIGKPLIQYEETDWAFIKRLASMLGTQLIPDTTTPFPRFSFGQVSKSSRELTADDFTLIMDERFYELGSSLAGMYKPDFFCHLVPSYQFVQLGAQVVFKEQSMVICEQDATLQDGELLYSYKIGHTGWFSQQEIKNEKLIGLSLPGSVIDTDREVVRLNLDIDAGRDAGTYPFSWIPESGNIMYCMPKLGTRASLYLPSHDTGEAVAITSPRTNGDTCNDMTDPQMRAFTTEHGKKMLLFPQSITFSGGLPGETLQMQFDDIKCMSLNSTRAIQIVAKLQIEITAPRVTLNTPQQLGTSRSPTQASARAALIVPKGTGGGNPPTGGGDTVMFMEYQFDALGEQGILCGTEFHNYPPYDDAPEAVEIAQFSWGQWALNLIIGAAITAVFVGAAIATAGTSVILTGALVGAAVGAGVATAAIAVSDAKSRTNRSTLDAIFGVAGGALLGATAGASIAAAPFAAEFYTPLINAQLAIWGIEGANIGIGVVTTGFLGITGLNALFTANNVVAMNSGYDFLGSTALFQNHPNIYMGLQLVTAVASMNVLGTGLMVESSATQQSKSEQNTDRYSSKTPVTAEEWEADFKERYGEQNVTWETAPKKPTYAPDYDTHMIESAGYGRSVGIKGAHNMDNFFNELSQYGDLDDTIVSMEAGDVPGIWSVTYQVPKKDGTGMILQPIEYRVISTPKTVYDPAIFSDQEMLYLGQSAMENGVMNSTGTMIEGWASGIHFVGYVNPSTGAIRNFHPVVP